MFIYIITNTVNSKVYIGQTIRPIKQRFQRHINDAMHNLIDTHFAKAIRKHGAESFVVELLDCAENQHELTIKEQYWIRKYNSTDPDFGYNETDAINKCGGNTYVSKTDIEMKEIQAKISKSKLGTKNPNAKGVKCFNVNTGQELKFNTLKDCQTYFNESTHRFITTRVTGKIHGLFRNEWKIAYLNCDYLEFHTRCEQKGTHLKIFDTITQQTLHFNSIKSACRQLGVSRNAINKHIRNTNLEFQIENYLITVLSQKCIDYP